MANAADTDWEARYQSNDMPWEKGAPSPGLVDFLDLRRPRNQGKVLVPGCGTGHDVFAWAERGFDAIGQDIAPSAVRLANERSREKGLNAKIHQGDFLSDPPSERVDWIFEHTLYCAIEPKRREDYKRAVDRWLKPDGRFLAVHYLIPDEDGPPFGTTRREILGRFSDILTLREEWIPRSYPNRQGLEMIFLWERR